MYDSLSGHTIFVRGSSLFECLLQRCPTWWRVVDFVFLVVSGFAVYRSMQTSSKKWVWRSLWAAWGVLTCSVLAEAFAHALFLPALKYTAASALIGLHFYNMKFCNVATQHAPSMKVDDKHHCHKNVRFVSSHA